MQIATLKLSTEEDELIDAKMKLDSKAEKVYFDLGEFFDKTLEVDVSEALKDSEDLESSSLTLGQLISAKKASSILKKEIKDQLIEDNMTTEKVNINDEKLTKNTLKITGKELAQMSANICKNLMENKKFTKCFENPEQTKKYLENVVETFEKGQFSEKFDVEISVYTKGIFKTVKRIDIVVSENNEKTSYVLTKVNKEEFVLEIEKDDKNVFLCDIKIQEKNDVYNIEFSFEQYEEKTVIKMAISYKYDEELTEVDTTNSVNVEKMSEKDSMKIYNNLANSKLYEIIEDISNSFYETTNSVDYDYY